MATEYISRETAVNACCAACGVDGFRGEELALCRKTCEDVQAIMSVPAADVVAVVRCMDCVHYIGYSQDCGLYVWGSNGLENPEPNDFCSKGVRKNQYDGRNSDEGYQ